MTIANEITRLQQAKEDIKVSVGNKGVTIPDGINLDNYPEYIDQIEQGGISQEEYDRVVEELTVAETFEPQTYYMHQAGYNSVGRFGFDKDIGDSISADGSKYIHYVWWSNDTSTARYNWNVFAFSKQPGQNWVATQLDGHSEGNSRQLEYHGVLSRMKLEGDSSIKMSTLCAILNYNSSNDYIYTNRWCITATDTTSEKVQLITTTNYQSPTPELLENWTEVCGITEQESISPINKTSISSEEETRRDNHYNYIITYL